MAKADPDPAPETDRFVASSLDELAQVVSISRQTLGQYVSRGLPRSQGDKSRTWRYPIKDVVRWLRVNIWTAPQIVGDESMLVGGESPGLERFRLARAEREEIALAAAKRETIPRAELHQGLSRIATVIRGAGETLQRVYGEDARAVLDGALDDCDREIVSVTTAPG